MGITSANYVEILSSIRAELKIGFLRVRIFFISSIVKLIAIGFIKPKRGDILDVGRLG